MIRAAFAEDTKAGEENKYPHSPFHHYSIGMTAWMESTINQPELFSPHRTEKQRDRRKRKIESILFFVYDMSEISHP